MNSVAKHLTAESKAATLAAMRSAKKEFLIVVEGDTDVDLYSTTLGMPRSNMLSCGGKEVLDSVYSMAPSKGIDPGTLFFRDRDHDPLRTGELFGVKLFVTDRYDAEMQLLESRIFFRIVNEFTKGSWDPIKINSVYDRIVSVAAFIGALRLFSRNNNLNIDFNDFKLTKFVDAKSLKIDVADMVAYFLSRSKISAINKEKIVDFIMKELETHDPSSIACGKDFIEVLSLALDRTFYTCKASECCVNTLSRMVRISANKDDLRQFSYYPFLTSHVLSGQYAWTGSQL